MNMIHDPDVLKTENLSSVFEETQQLVFRAARDKQPVHGVEKAIWEQLLLLGHKLLGQFFALAGTGDMGEGMASALGVILFLIIMPISLIQWRVLRRDLQY